MLAGTRQGGKHITWCRTGGSKSARRVGQLSYRGIAPYRCAPAAQHPAPRVVVNVREQGGRRTEHDEAVKVVNFSRDGKPEEEIVASKRANRCWRARGPGSRGRRSVTATRFASVLILTHHKTGLSL